MTYIIWISTILVFVASNHTDWIFNIFHSHTFSKNSNPFLTCGFTLPNGYFCGKLFDIFCCSQPSVNSFVGLWIDKYSPSIHYTRSQAKWFINILTLFNNFITCNGCLKLVCYVLIQMNCLRLGDFFLFLTWFWYRRNCCW